MSDHMFIAKALDAVVERLEDLHDYTHEAEGFYDQDLTAVRHKIEEAVGPLYSAAEAAWQANGERRLS